ncbi:transcriptional regulator [Avibacterium avium]|uniref:transcriptional regulator n=1 Tax=Avibacterium avium TaxID=751 RepID=UPI003BF7B28C
MAINIKFPFCGGDTKTRTSHKPSLLSVKATIYCPNCGQLKAQFMGQLYEVKRAVYIDCPEAQKWNETEKEQIDKGTLKAVSNQERLDSLMKKEEPQQKFKF